MNLTAAICHFALPLLGEKKMLVISFDLNWAFKKLFLLMNHIKPLEKGSLTLFK